MSSILLHKNVKYRIYLLDVDSEEQIKIQMKNNNYFTYLKKAKYLIDFNYNGMWLSIEVETKEHPPMEFIKYFHTIICIETRKQLIKRGFDGDVDFRILPFTLSRTFLS